MPTTPPPDPFDPTTWNEDSSTTVTIDTYGDWYATIDAVDLPLVRSLNVNWCMKPDHCTIYARAHKTINGRRVGIYMHRLIMFSLEPPPTPQHTIVDHRDGNGLNNRRNNLRWATPRDNRLNVGSYRKNLDLFRTLWDERNPSC